MGFFVSSDKVFTANKYKQDRTHVGVPPCHLDVLMSFYDLDEDFKDEDEDGGEAWEMSQSGHCPVESIAVSTCPPVTMSSNVNCADMH